jgi:hypothetical protein
MTNKLNLLYNSHSHIHLFSCELTKFVGKNESILLNQINYWLSKCGREINGLNGLWIYNSLNEWHKQFNYWSLSTLRRTIKSLEKYGVLISKKINARKWNHTKWYSIDYNKLKQLTKYSDIKKEDIDKNLNNLPKTNYLNKSINSSKNIRTYRCVQNEQIIITKNNYTNNISSNKESDMNLNNTPDPRLEEIQIDSNEKEMVDKMLYVWNKVFECSVNPIKAYSSQKNQQTLLHLYKTAFNSDLDNWRGYALKVNSSQFLMGEKETKNNFKAVFSWLIKEETIEKIQNGEYGVGDRELDMNNVSKNIEVKKEELVSKMDKKISEYMKLNIDEVKERKEFDEYVKTHKTEIKDDEYGVLGMIKHISYHSLFKTSEYEVLKESLYESYVMKKYLNITKMEARKKIRNNMKEIIKDRGRKERILEILDKKEKEIECLELSRNMTKIGLHSIL